MVGYGHKTGIDLPHEAEGVVPSRKWKIRNFREKWYPGENISVGIGQGATTVTPLADGLGHRRHRDRRNVVPAAHGQRRRASDARAARRSQSGQHPEKWSPACTEWSTSGGTGVRAHLPGIDVCGKTGSAQLVSNDATQGKGFKQGKDMKDNAWFVGFAPCNAPEIVVATLFENGEHGQLAAPIVRDVHQSLLRQESPAGPTASRRSPSVPPSVPPTPPARAPGPGSRPQPPERIHNMAAHRSIRDFDWLMLVLVTAICGLGVLQIFSATCDTHYSEAWWKQVIWIVAAFIAMWIATLIDYHTLLGQVPVLYALSVATLVATYVRRHDRLRIAPLDRNHQLSSPGFGIR